MGWRLFKRIRILPGVRLNISRSGPSLSLGGRGLTKTFGRRGTRTTVSIPGSGISYTDLEASGRVRRSCEACGKQLRPQARFCDECGAAQ